MKSKDKNSRSLGVGERICKALELPSDVLAKKSSVEIHGRSLVKIFGGGAILLYSPSEMRVSLRDGSGAVSVRGVSLSCTSYNMGAVGIEGRICSVCFLEKEDKI